MSKQTVLIRVDSLTAKLIKTRCKEIWKKHHKDFKDVNISSGFIINKMVDFWIDGE